MKVTRSEPEQNQKAQKINPNIKKKSDHKNPYNNTF